MAPKRRGRPRKTNKPAADAEPQKQETPPQALASVDADPADEEENAESEPSPKKAKVEEKGKKTRGRKPKAASKKAATAAAASKKAAPPDEDDEESAEGEDAEEEGKEETIAKPDKVILIEASKECNCFKTRAAKVQAGLSKAFPGIEVQINPDMPRKGCFEVRDEDGNIYLSLLGLPRPFTKLKKLDMDKAVEEIVAKVK